MRCTDEAQKAETVLSAVTYIYIYIYTYIYIHTYYIYILIIIYPCSIVLDAFAERGLSEGWTNQ